MSLPILDVAIGLSFIYLLLALICCTLNELVAGVLKKRAAFLELGITRLLNGDLGMKQAFSQHALIRGMTDEGEKLPSYMSNSQFAVAFLDVLTGPGKSRCDIQAIRDGANQLENARLKASLNAMFASQNLDAAGAQRLVEAWFADSMDRVKGWYKRNAQVWILALSLLVTLGLNADTLHVARALWVNPTLRAQMVDEARVRGAKDRPEELLPLAEYPNPNDATESKPLNVPNAGLSDNEQKLLEAVMGWPDAGPGERGNWWLWGLAKMLGWAMTATAVSLGAPFWFDTLNRFMNIRNAGRSPEEKRGKTEEVK